MSLTLIDAFMHITVFLHEKKLLVGELREKMFTKMRFYIFSLHWEIERFHKSSRAKRNTTTAERTEFIPNCSQYEGRFDYKTRVGGFSTKACKMYD